MFGQNVANQSRFCKRKCDDACSDSVVHQSSVALNVDRSPGDQADASHCGESQGRLFLDTKYESIVKSMISIAAGDKLSYIDSR